MYDYQYEKLKEAVVLLFNQKMERENSCIRYIKDDDDSKIQSYKMAIVDKYIDNKYAPMPNLTTEGERDIKGFIEGYGVKFQFSNTVYNII